MSALSEALLFLDMDKGKDPSLEKQRGDLRKDPRLRAGWFQYQALQALALETSPAPNEKMLRSVMEQCRREHVRHHLSLITGGNDELAREILLGKIPQSRGPAWLLGLLMLAALGLGWTMFHGSWPGSNARSQETAADATGSAPPGNLPSGLENPVPFEFPVQTPPSEEALSAPVDEPSASDADDVHGEPPAAQQASRLLREHLHEAEAREQASDKHADEDEESDVPAAAAASVTAQAPVQSAATETTPHFTTVQAPAVQAGAPNPPQSGLALDAGAVPPPLVHADAALAGPAHSLAESPTAKLNKDPAIHPGLTLSSDALLATAAPVGLTPSPSVKAGPLDIMLSMPQRRDIDVRLFTPAGKSTRILASGAFGPGKVHLLLDAKDDQRRALEPGTYYLRVMTPWFSRVEPIQIH